MPNIHKTRVVITGLGVCAPNGVGLPAFTQAIRSGTSGISHSDQLAQLKFSCQIAGAPKYDKAVLQQYFNSVQLRGLHCSGIEYGVMAGMDAWKDAGLSISEEEPDWDSGIIFGTGILGVDKFREAILKIDAGNVRRLGSTSVLQTMASGISAYLGGILGCGNLVTTNSSACATGIEALLMGYERIKNGHATRMLVGSCSDSGPYVWGGFDAMRILPNQYNDHPEAASRPMSRNASGFVPGSGAGALVLETLESAQQRNATIYGEIVGGNVNSGGQRGGGSLTAPNNIAVQRCIQAAIATSGIEASAIDAINGHLTATTKDVAEIHNWRVALGCGADNFPYINSLKSMVGHCLAAAGSIESVATVLQLKEAFVFGNINCEELHPEIATLLSRAKVPEKTLALAPHVIAKASFGFGDVNACVIFRKYEP